MSCFEEEGGWSLSFSGAAFLGTYHLGVSQGLRECAPRLLRGARRIYGTSVGALGAITIIMGASIEFSCDQILGLARKVEQLSLGAFHPAFSPIEHIRQQLRAVLPSDIHVLASRQLGVSLTRWPDGQNVIITDFATRDEVIQALICSLYVPFYCGVIPPEFRGERYMDGALSNSLPFADCPSTITVSPFVGTVDICPPSSSPNLLEVSISNASFQISAGNCFLGFTCLLAPSTEVMAHYCRQGYLDALRFLERRGLSQEPVLWTLLSKEPPPAPDPGAQDTGHGRGQKAGLTLNWAVPHVLVKDVPDFGQLSPELEAALRKATRRDPRPWARFRQSTPGKALAYLLLPCTLPFEFVYFRGRRLVLWLPDMPADLWWVQGELRRGALWLCCRVRDRLLARLSPPVASRLPPRGAPPAKKAQKPLPSACRA